MNGRRRLVIFCVAGLVGATAAIALLPRREQPHGGDGVEAHLREDAARRTLLAGTCDALERSWRVRGPWPQERAQLDAVLAAAGAWAQPGLAGLPEAERLRQALARLQLARREAGDPADPRIARLLAACPEPAWRGLGAAAEVATPAPAGLSAGAGGLPAAVLEDAATCDLVLASFAPAPVLAEAAQRRLRDDPGAFWPRVHLARAAAWAGDWPAVRGHALVALGRESASRHPRLLLAYADAAAADWASALVDATHAAAALDDAEAAAIQAVALAGLGRHADAATRLASSGAGALLRRRLGDRQGHPLERIADAAGGVGLALPEPALSPTP